MTTAPKALYRLGMLIAAAAVATIALSACNTIEGAGQDIESTGKAIERSADDNK
ncbi:MAG: entericidin A/B family lipoprotein [Rhodospirillaceae bacterium]|nr:entericidin A/B family lipoprotein [Rhodospirillaceae bacterium]